MNAQEEEVRLTVVVPSIETIHNICIPSAYLYRISLDIIIIVYHKKTHTHSACATLLPISLHGLIYSFSAVGLSRFFSQINTKKHSKINQHGVAAFLTWNGLLTFAFFRVVPGVCASVLLIVRKKCIMFYVGRGFLSRRIKTTITHLRCGNMSTFSTINTALRWKILLFFLWKFTFPCTPKAIVDSVSRYICAGRWYFSNPCQTFSKVLCWFINRS